MAETGGLTARCLRAARRLLPAGVRRESGELARLAGPVVRAGDAGTGAARGAGGPERSFRLSFPRSRRCSEALRCRLHPPADTDWARLWFILYLSPSEADSLPAVSFPRRCVGSPGFGAGLG